MQDTPVASKKYQSYAIVALALLFASVLVATIQFKVPTIMMDIAKQFEMNASAASWLMSIFTFVGILLALPTGSLAKRFGPKTMFVAAGAIVVIGSLLGAFAQTSALLIVSRAIEGLALVVVTVAGPLVVQKYVAPERIGSGMGILSMWVALGSVIGGVVTPTLYAATGLKGVWLIYALIAVVAFALVALVIKEPGKRIAESGAEAVEDVQEQAEGRVSYSEIFTGKVMLFMVGFLTFNFAVMTVLAFSPVWMQANGMSKTLSGFISTLPMLLVIVSSPLFGAISDRIGRRKPLLLLALFVMGPCAFLLLNTTGPLLWAGAIIMGLVGLGAPAMVLASFPNVLARPALMSIGMGLLTLVQALGQFLGSWVTSICLGPAMANWTLAGIVVMLLGLVGTGAVALCKFK